MCHMCCSEREISPTLFSCGFISSVAAYIRIIRVVAEAAVVVSSASAASVRRIGRIERRILRVR